MTSGAFLVSKLSKNHTGKLRVHNTFATNKLILQPKASTFFSNKDSINYLSIYQTGERKASLPLALPKTRRDRGCSQPSRFLSAAAPRRAGACVSGQMDLNLPASHCGEVGPLHMLHFTASHSHLQEFTTFNIN